MGNPLDGKRLEKFTDNWPLNGKAVNPLERKKITSTFNVGVRTINSIVTIGKGAKNWNYSRKWCREISFATNDEQIFRV